MASAKVTIPELQARKGNSKFTMLTAYDAPMAQLVDEAGVDVILVGDSLGVVMLGYSGTAPVTMDEMIHHAKAVGRTAKRALLVGDMPFMSYQADTAEAVRNAYREYRRLQHGLRLNNQPGRVDPAAVATMAAAVRALWKHVFDID